MRGRNDRLPIVSDPISSLTAQANVGQGHRDGGAGMLSYIDRGLEDIAGQMDALSVLRSVLRDGAAGVLGRTPAKRSP